MSRLDADQLEDLQSFLKDWLRHAGRTQADLRRALRAPSIRMPVLVEELRLLYARQGLLGLAERLCEIEQRWQIEEHLPSEDDEAMEAAGLADSFGQLDLLLEEIRQGS